MMTGLFLLVVFAMILFVVLAVMTEGEVIDWIREFFTNLFS